MSPPQSIPPPPLPLTPHRGPTAAVAAVAQGGEGAPPLGPSAGGPSPQAPDSSPIIAQADKQIGDQQ